ncbi:hypothetical protein L596_011540 [Steinernema carpocapsae]|uniref:Uncharacterized protein n=1 Tax=Steinernema carpocapsae TaxID=34508 RepID=A0A4U5NV37_STECR|nr:hypothetical protein L596_011540 [Steinernema carpocapsae]
MTGKGAAGLSGRNGQFLGPAIDVARGEGEELGLGQISVAMATSATVCRPSCCCLHGWKLGLIAKRPSGGRREGRRGRNL